MAVPIDLLDQPAVMSYGGLVDASTAEGQVDEEADWCGAVAALLAASVAQRRPQSRPTPSLSGAAPQPVRATWAARCGRARRARPREARSAVLAESAGRMLYSGHTSRHPATPTPHRSP